MQKLDEHETRTDLFLIYGTYSGPYLDGSLNKRLDLIHRKIVLCRNDKESQNHGTLKDLHSRVTLPDFSESPYPDK